MRAVARVIAAERQSDINQSMRKPWWHESWKKDIVKEAWSRLPPKAPANAAAKRGTKRQRSECVVCMDAAPEWAFAPCMHMCLCSACKETQAGDLDKCPICRKKRASFVRVY